MNIETIIRDDVLYIQFNGELDEYTSNYTRKSLDDAFQVNKFNSVVLDMSNLDFMDSTGIGVLLGRYKALKTKNKSIYITNPNQTIEKIINMSGIYEIMPKIS
jgi:stage II sporulation protein AA (anti-sigma F factor antagonist)